MATGHDWKHGYIPLTPQAMREKNHGRPVKPGSWVTKLPGAGTGKERGPKVGETAAGKALHVGDVVHVHTGPHAGKRGVVFGAAGKGRVLVGKPGTTGQGFFAQNQHVVHASDHHASQAMDNLLRSRSGRRTITQTADLSTPQGRAAVRKAQRAAEQAVSPTAAQQTTNAVTMHGTAKTIAGVAADVRTISPVAAALLDKARTLTAQGRTRAANNAITKAYNEVARTVANQTNRKKQEQGRELLNRIRALR